MKIGIDARLYHQTGVGRYIRNLISHLQKIDTHNSYVVFFMDDTFDSFKIPNKRWQKRLAPILWHSLAEQTMFIPLLLKENLDLVHFPYFSYPILYPGKFIVTIHDMIVSHFDTGTSSTLSPFMYQIKRLGYQLNHYIGLRRAQRIIAVSQSTKKEIVATVGIQPEKISVMYEEVDFELLKLKSGKKSLVDEPYLLYVGNAYPHKNLDTLLKAFEIVRHKAGKELKLVLAGPNDVFYQRLKKNIQGVQFFGPATDRELVTLYAHAQALISPSLMEGFGLPIIEALSFNMPIIASDIPVYRELFDDLVNFFNPHSAEELAKLLQNAVDKKLLKINKEEIAKRFQNFSWQKSAQKTLELYQSTKKE